MGKPAGPSAGAVPLTVDIEVRLRDRNQLTLPDRIVERMHLAPGDRLVAAFDVADPEVVRLRKIRGSYAGIGATLWKDEADVRTYLEKERQDWEPFPRYAEDGTRLLTFEDSKRAYPQTEVTWDRYVSEPKLRWPKCDICGRSLALMGRHTDAHRSGLLDERGVRTDPGQKARSRRRVAKWRRSVSARKTR